MQKKLIALAIAAAFSAPAFADTAVTVYGQAHVSLDRATTYDALGNSVSNISMSSNSSRLGVKGESTLDNGMTGFFQIESAISFTKGDAGSSFVHRASVAGLKGDFGSLSFGYRDDVYKDTFKAFDVMGNTVGDSRNILGANNTNGKDAFDQRTKNGIYYYSPNMSGFQLGLGYSTDWKDTGIATQNDNKGNLTDITLKYSNGGWFVMAGNEQQNFAAAGVQTHKLSGTRVLGGYKTGPMDIRVIYEKTSNSGTLYNAAIDRNAAGAAFVLKVGGPGSVILQYMKVGKSAATAGADGATQATVGYAYSLAKNSKVYVMYDSVSNDTNANFGIGAGHDSFYQNAVNGKSVSALSAGYVYKF